MSHQVIPKLNKRLIYICLFGVLALSIPAIISLASTKEKSDKKSQEQHHPQVNLNSQDGVILSGMERFPENYGGVKEFEEELALAKPKEPLLENGLADLETKQQNQAAPAPSYYHAAEDDPWAELKKREQKQQANDHYQARRSDIMFIDNSHANNRPDAELNDDEAMFKMLEMAQKSQPPSDSNDMFFVKEGSATKKPQGFLGANKQGAGQLKDPTPYMISEGTLIHAILLSEINTDLPGPILARVSHNIWDSKTGKALLIPQNSKLIGEYNSSVGHGQSRAQIIWTRIIYPNQQSVDLARMVGVDTKGTSGTAGNVNNHYDKVAIGLFMSTALGAGVRMTQGKYEANTASVSQELGSSLAHETASLGNKIVDKMMGIKPTITVPMGERLNVFVEMDLSLRPYEG